MEEITYNSIKFKEIKNFPKYYISKCGKVYSSKSKKVLSINLNSVGYKIIILYNKRLKNISIHRLVAETFIPNPNNKPCVNHIDGNKLNNHISNLEWCTYSENNKHAIKLGLNSIRANKIKQIDKHTNEVIKIWDSISLAGKFSGDKYNMILDICNGIPRKSNKYIWSYL